jgi:hypothetical protein
LHIPLSSSLLSILFPSFEVVHLIISQVLYEELQECAFPNNLSPGDTVGGLSYISNLEEHVSGDIEALSVRTVGVKNCDVHRALAGKGLPAEVT